MAACKVSKNQFACISKEKIIVFEIGGSEKQIYRSECPKIPDQEQKRQPQGTEEGRDLILCCGFSPSGRYFASCDDYKQLTVWQVTTATTGHGDVSPGNRNQPWTKLSTRTLIRRPTSLIFARDESAILIGDKSGDVYSFSMTELEQDGQLLLGHVSMLLDMVLCDGDRLLATSDRDDKIRVSHYANGYNIQSYCLGHTDFVSRLGYFDKEDLLVSASGDGSLRVWNYRTGEELSSTQCSDHIQPDLEQLQCKSVTPEEEETMDTDNANPATVERSLESDWKKAKARSAEDHRAMEVKCLSCGATNQTVAVGFDKLPVILLYKLNGVTLTFTQKVTLDAPLWDLDMDAEGRLWVLQAQEGCPLVVYHRTTPDAQMEKVAEAPVVVTTTIKAVNDNWAMIKDSVDQDTIFSVLHKVKMDNIAIYQQQKEKKMEELKQRYKEKQERRKRNKHVLPPGDCKESDEEPEVEPPSECSENDTDDKLSKKLKVSPS